MPDWKRLFHIQQNAASVRLQPKPWRLRITCTGNPCVTQLQNCVGEASHVKQTQMGAPHKSAYGCIAAFMQRSLSVKVCLFYADM